MKLSEQREHSGGDLLGTYHLWLLCSYAADGVVIDFFLGFAGVSRPVC